MYEIVNESEARKYRRECSTVLTKTCAILKRKGISAQFTLVGSGARNLITRNGNGPYDLDYNLEILKAPDDLWNNLHDIKNTVRNALNKANGFDFSDAHDSTSVLTCLRHFNNESIVEFKFDVAIVSYNVLSGRLQKLVHNKNALCFGPNGQFTWNEIPNSHDVTEKAQAIKDEGQQAWELVRQRYVDKKNMYLCRQDRNHQSFIVYIEAVNEIYNQIFSEAETEAPCNSVNGVQCNTLLLYTDSSFNNRFRRG